MAADALRRPARLDDLIAACRADACSRPGRGDDYPQGDRLRAALAVVRSVDAGAVAVLAVSRATARAARDGAKPGPAAAGKAPDAKIAEAIRAARVAALREWKKAQAADDPAARPAGDPAADQMR
jgi:tRNA nucleotidyltransferase (CCA-adding enzyme)